jgi:hypothetical protein
MLRVSYLRIIEGVYCEKAITEMMELITSN